jgi:hypothetical protein
MTVLGSLILALARAILVATALAGCAASVRSAATEAPRAAVPVVVDESLKSLEDAKNRERIDRILATPEMHRAIRQTAASAARGTFEGAAEERKAIFGAIDEVVAFSTRTAAQNAAAAFPETLAPVLRETLVSTLTSPDVRAALDGLTAEATRTALLSSRDVIREIHEESKWPDIVTKLQRLLVGTLVAAFVLGTLASGLLAWALRVRRRSQASEAATRELLGVAAKATEGKAWSGEMLELLARQMNASRVRELQELMKH